MWTQKLIDRVNEREEIVSRNLSEEEAVGLLLRTRPTAGDKYAAVLGRYRDGMSVKAVGDLAGVSASTAQRWINDCLRTIRAEYVVYAAEGLVGAAVSPREVKETLAALRRPRLGDDVETPALLLEVLERLDELNDKTDAVAERLEEVDERFRNEVAKFRSVVRILAQSLNKEYTFINDLKRATTAFTDELTRDERA